MITLISFQCSDFDQFSGTKLYYPPEYFTHKRYSGEHLDFWGASLVLYEMVEGVRAFRFTDEITDDQPLFHKETSSLYKKFIDEALEKDRSNRLDIGTVWSQLWMKDAYNKR